MTKMISMSEAWRRDNVRLAASAFNGCPVGGWAETKQAKLALLNELPSRTERDWSLDDLISAVFYVNSIDRYAIHTDAEERLRAAKESPADDCSLRVGKVLLPTDLDQKSREQWNKLQLLVMRLEDERARLIEQSEEAREEYNILVLKNSVLRGELDSIREQCKVRPGASVAAYARSNRRP